MVYICVSKIGHHSFVVFSWIIDYMNHRWAIVNVTISTKNAWNMNQNTTIIIQENRVENIEGRTAVIRPLSVHRRRGLLTNDNTAFKMKSALPLAKILTTVPDCSSCLRSSVTQGLRGTHMGGGSRWCHVCYHKTSRTISTEANWSGQMTRWITLSYW